MLTLALWYSTGQMPELLIGNTSLTGVAVFPFNPHLNQFGDPNCVHLNLHLTLLLTDEFTPFVLTLRLPVAPIHFLTHSSSYGLTTRMHATLCVL